MIIPEIRHVVSLETECRIDAYLAQKICSSRAEAQRWLTENRVLFNNRHTKSSQIVKNGDVLLVSPPDLKQVDIHPQNLDLQIIFEDKHLLVVNKPAGLVTHPGAGNENTSLVHGLLAMAQNLSGIGGVKRPGIVHRLDKDTSGLMVVAKNDKAHQNLSEQFANKKIYKEYLALCKGKLFPVHGSFESLIKRSEQNRKRFVVNKKKGKLAITHYQVLSQTDTLSLAHVKIDTGRTHQIRVHFSYAGFALLGDAVYGGLKFLQSLASENPALTGIQRTLLHSFRLGFEHPVTKKFVLYTLPPPDDFGLACRELLNFKNWNIPVFEKP